jgi:hypothetical protein
MERYYNELNEAKPAGSNGKQKIRWEKSADGKLFHQLQLDGFSAVQSDHLGVLNVKCKIVEQGLPNKEMILDPTHNLGHIQGLNLHFNHFLHNSGAGNGEDVLQGSLKLRNEGREPVKIKISFTTSAQPHKNTEDQIIYIPISAAGLFRDERLAELGSMGFLQECEQKIGKNNFSCHYLEPHSSNPEIRATEALLLAPVVDIQHPASSWRIALFTPSEEPYQFTTTKDENGNVGWLAQKQIEVSPGSSEELRCFLFCHKGEADAAWNLFHQLAHKEEFDTPDWLYKVKVHYYDFLSSAGGEKGIRGDGYDADLPHFKEFNVGLATQHGYYPNYGDYLNPERISWMAMQGSPNGAARMSIQKMKDRINATRKAGAKAAVYLHTACLGEASPFFDSFKDSVLVGPEGKRKTYSWDGPDTIKQNWWMSVASNAWTDHLLKQAGYIMEILNPDAIVVDETFLCLGYDHHPDRQVSLSKYGIEFFKKLRRLVHSYGKDKAVLTSDCGMGNMVMWADGEAGDHAYPALLGHSLYRKEPIRYKAALGPKPWIPCAWNFTKMWKEQMDLALKSGIAVGVSNGWEEYSGLNGLDASTRSRLLKDIESL